MNDAKKTKKQLIEELAAARAREEALRESEDLYRSVVESIDTGFNLIDCDHNIVMVNAASGAMLKKPPREIVGNKCFREFEKRDAVCPHCPGVQVIATGLPAEAETEGVRDDGSRFNVLLRAIPTFGPDGTVKGFIEITSDITEQKQAEETLQRRGAVLGAIALAAEKLLRPSDWEQDMQTVLAYLGQAVDVSRALIFQASMSDEGKYLLSGRYEWITPEAKLAPLEGIQNVPVFRRWRDLLPRGEIVTGHVRDFSAREQEFFVPRGIKSVLIVPIFVSGAWWGFMGFDQGETEREWTEVEISTLKTAANILGGALERQQAQEALEKAYAEVERQVEERTAELKREIAERERAQEESARLQQEVIEAQKQALQELSTPIIPIMERIIVMPLIGSIDTMRAKDILRALLAGIREHRAKVVILDITGVPIVDSGVANHLHKTIQAARLKGARTIVTGISDAVAETIVDLGIDWSGIETLSNLRTGLIVALDGLGIELAKRDTVREL
jgi:PAS domain S-box-containing protein